jgi:hypothetical protein
MTGWNATALFQALRVNCVGFSLYADPHRGEGFLKPAADLLRVVHRQEVLEDAHLLGLLPPRGVAAQVVYLKGTILKPGFHLIGSRVETTWVPGAFQLWAAMGQGESTCAAPLAMVSFILKYRCAITSFTSSSTYGDSLTDTE